MTRSHIIPIRFIIIKKHNYVSIHCNYFDHTSRYFFWFIINNNHPKINKKIHSPINKYGIIVYLKSFVSFVFRQFGFFFSNKNEILTLYRVSVPIHENKNNRWLAILDEWSGKPAVEIYSRRKSIFVFKFFWLEKYVVTVCTL